MLVQKVEMQENEKTEDATQNFLDLSDRAQKKLFREVGSFKKRWSIIMEKLQEYAVQQMTVEQK